MENHTELALEANANGPINEPLPPLPVTERQNKRGRPPNNPHDASASSSDSPPPKIAKRIKNQPDNQTAKTPHNKIRHCMCQNPKACRKIMTRWLGIKGGKGRVGYLNLPLEVTKAKETLNAQHVMAFREGVFRYLYKEGGGLADGGAAAGQTKLPALPQADGNDPIDGEDVGQASSNQQDKNDQPTKAIPKDQRIAYCHFHPKVIEQLIQQKEQYMLKRLRWRISFALGTEIGLLPQDVCPQPDSNGEITYFALPNYSLEAATADIETAEQNHAQRLANCKKSQTKLAKLISAEPHKYALEILDLREQNALLAAEVQELKSKLKTEQGLRTKVDEKNQSMDRRLKMTRHKLEKVVESKRNHVKRGRPPKTETEMEQAQPMLNPIQFPVDMGTPAFQGWGNNNLEQFLHQDRYPNVLITHDEKWDYRYQQLLAYLAKFGNCDVPRGWKVNKPLGKWVDNQRVMNAHGRLAQARVDKLNSIGFTWRKTVPLEKAVDPMLTQMI